jgi:hypothetical protein
MTPAANFATSFASVVVTGGNLSPVSTILAAKPVSTTPVAMRQVANKEQYQAAVTLNLKAKLYL